MITKELNCWFPQHWCKQLNGCSLRGDFTSGCLNFVWALFMNIRNYFTTPFTITAREWYQRRINCKRKNIGKTDKQLISAPGFPCEISSQVHFSLSVHNISSSDLFCSTTCSFFTLTTNIDVEDKGKNLTLGWYSGETSGWINVGPHQVFEWKWRTNY